MKDKKNADRQKQINNGTDVRGTDEHSLNLYNSKIKVKGILLTVLSMPTSAFKREAGHPVRKEVEGTSQMVVPKLSHER